MDFKILNKAMRFEKVVGKILSLNYNINNGSLYSEKLKFDYQTSNNVKIEVKYNSKNDIFHFLHLVRNYSHDMFTREEKLIFITNTSGYFDYYRKNQDLIAGKFASCNLHIITLENLLFLCQNNENLKMELLSCLDFSTEFVVPTQLDHSVLCLLDGAKKQLKNKEEPIQYHFFNELESISTGKRAFAKYESFCQKFISTIFQNNIDAPKSQLRNNKELFRFDIIAALKSEPESFWRFIYDKFNSYFILFECKNFSEKIGQEQIYITEKYLFDKALRNVAIILTRVGANDHAHLAVHDILKEHGKLILILEDQDLKNLEKYYYDENLSPSEYL
ncbi:MAG: hypothetical protein K2I36_02225, partial [Ureaplasma sp.]|nr:hypothetical protein [Ureaplasma sp.]